MKAKLFCIAMLVSVFALANKQLERINYDWDSNPVLTNISYADTNISLCFLKNYISRELIYENNSLTEYFLDHKRVKVLTDAGIKAYNTIYLPVNNKDDLIKVKARVINSNGEIIELKASDIKEGVDEETESKYLYFAFEGIDINSEVEYIYFYKRSPIFRSNITDVQRQVPQQNYSFELITPYGLVFAFKSYNGLPEIQNDTTLLKSKEKNRWHLEMENVELLPKQKSSAHSAHLMGFGYKLSKNLYQGKSDLFSYGELSRLVHILAYENHSKQDVKFMKKLAKDVDIEKDMNEEEKIRAVEEFVKSNLTIRNFSFTGNIDIKTLWTLKIASLSHAAFIMANIYRHLGINVEVGLTCDRFNMKFDEEFELWSYASDYILYFPSIDKYTTPGNFDRLGFPDNDFIGNKGIFVKTMKISGQEYGVGTVREISVPDYKLSGDTLIVTADLKSQGFVDVTYDVYHSATGYKAQIYQPILGQITDEDTKKEISESMINYIDDTGDVSDMELKNTNAASYGLLPVIATGKLTSNKYFERAENRQLFKVGELIGPQMEMYDAKERVLPVEDPYTRHYYRVIRFTIPDDYNVLNLENLNMDVSYKDKKGKELMAFRSKYSVKGDMVEVIVEEFYAMCVFPLEIFSDYQKVVNAAADFNKIVVVFEKK